MKLLQTVFPIEFAYVPMFIFQASVPVLVRACTVQSDCRENTSEVPVELGTAGTSCVTVVPLLGFGPGYDQSTVPIGKLLPARTVTSAEALPAVIVAFPAARAVSIGGSSVESDTTDGLLEVHVKPLTGIPLASTASREVV